MHKRLGVIVGVTMLGVAGIVVSQTNLVSAPIRGQLVPDGMLSSTGYADAQNELQQGTMSSTSYSENPEEDAAVETSSETSSVSMQNSVSSSEAASENEKWDCEGIRDTNEKMCNTLELDGTLLCSDGERDCKDTCTWPVPFNYMCEHSCETARADCEYQLEKKVSACNDRTSASFIDCLEHNASL